jgi:hypothetical protein
MFPRQAVQASYTGLFYAVDGTDIAFTPGARPSDWNMGTSVPVSSAPFDPAPLPLPDGMQFLRFLYESKPLGRRMIFAAYEGPDGRQSVDMGLFSAMNAAGDNFHAAIQTQLYPKDPPMVSRIYWTTNRDSTGGSTGPTRLVTSAGGPGFVGVPIELSPGCPTTEPDLEPWLTPDGGLLLVSSHGASEKGCISSNDGRRIYLVFTDRQTGQQMTGAHTIDLSYLHASGFDDRGPSLTSDMCTLLFASDRGAKEDFDIYAAQRD